MSRLTVNEILEQTGGAGVAIGALTSKVSAAGIMTGFTINSSQLTSTGYIATIGELAVTRVGSPSTISAAAIGDVVLAHTSTLRMANTAGSSTLAMIGGMAGIDYVVLGGQTDTADTGNLTRGPYWLAASLPAGAANRNGIFSVDATNNRWIFYSGGNRYFIAGTAF